MGAAFQDWAGGTQLQVGMGGAGQSWGPGCVGGSSIGIGLDGRHAAPGAHGSVARVRVGAPRLPRDRGGPRRCIRPRLKMMHQQQCAYAS